MIRRIKILHSKFYPATPREAEAERLELAQSRPSPNEDIRKSSSRGVRDPRQSNLRTSFFGDWRDILSSRRGFTLVEILVIIAVTALLSAYIVSYQRTGQRQILLYVETQKMAGLILKAKSLAIESFADTSQGNCGYGLAVNYGSGSYGLFYYTTSTPDTKSKYVQCSAIKKTGVLASGRITALLAATPLNPEIVFRTPVPTDAIYYVLFVPPDPETLIADNNGNISPSSGAVYLETKDGLAKSTITVNPAGQVNF